MSSNARKKYVPVTNSTSSYSVAIHNIIPIDEMNPHDYYSEAVEGIIHPNDDSDYSNDDSNLTTTTSSTIFDESHSIVSSNERDREDEGIDGNNAAILVETEKDNNQEKYLCCHSSLSSTLSIPTTPTTVATTPETAAGGRRPSSSERLFEEESSYLEYDIADNEDGLSVVSSSLTSVESGCRDTPVDDSGDNENPFNIYNCNDYNYDVKRNGEYPGNFKDGNNGLFLGDVDVDYSVRGEEDKGENKNNSNIEQQYHPQTNHTEYREKSYNDIIRRMRKQLKEEEDYEKQSQKSETYSTSHWLISSSLEKRRNKPLLVVDNLMSNIINEDKDGDGDGGDLLPPYNYCYRKQDLNNVCYIDNIINRDNSIFRHRGDDDGDMISLQTLNEQIDILLQEEEHLIRKEQRLNERKNLLMYEIESYKTEKRLSKLASLKAKVM